MGLLTNDKVSIAYRGLCFGQRIILTHNYVVLGDFPVVNSVAQDLQLILNGIAAGGVNDIETPYLACLPPQYTLSEVRAQRILPVRSAYVSNGFVGVVGTNAGAATVANDAACVTMRTALAGRKQVANQHIGPVPDNVSVAGLITAAYKLTLTSLGTRLITSFVPPASGSLVAPIILHRPGGTFDIINNFILGDQSRVQRRRTVGVGE